MKVYHGSYTAIENIDLSKSQRGKDFGIIETEAVNIYYKSNTYTQLADETTGLYKKSWTDIYQMLKMELKM